MARYEAYNSTKEKALAKIESQLKLKNFTSSLPAAISKDKSLCSELHKSMINNIMSQIAEFSAEVEDSVKLKDHLQRLDEIVQDSENQTSSSWRPSRIPLDNQVSKITHAIPKILKNP